MNMRRSNPEELPEFPGLSAVSGTLLCTWIAERNHRLVLVFGAASLAGGGYLVFHHAPVLGILLAVWSIAAARTWWCFQSGSSRQDSSAKTRLVVIPLVFVGLLVGCEGHTNVAAEAPPPAQVEEQHDSTFQVVDPKQFPLATAIEHDAVSQLVVTGSVSPDVARTVPVVTLASGRVVDVRARLGDAVKKGRLLLLIRSDDVASGYSDYRKAIADELLTRKQLDRANLLYSHGAIPQVEVETAQDAEDDAKVTLETTTEHLRLLGNDPNNPSGLVEITAPITGVITDQQVVNGSTIQSYSANPFTISDLSHVWIVCDVYENDIADLHLGETADVRLNAFPTQTFKGTISNIGEILDPNLRTAKVRIEVANPGLMRIGMFATATFYGLKKDAHAAVPASAVVHLHDRDWVYVPATGAQFTRVEVTSGDMLPNGMQEILTGVQPREQVVVSALALQNAIDNQ